jgi:phospholipase C
MVFEMSNLRTKGPQYCSKAIMANRALRAYAFLRPQAPGLTALVCIAALAMLSGCHGMSTAPTEPSPTAEKIVVTVQTTGTGKGTIKSTSSGIDCGTACTSELERGAVVTLEAQPQPGSSFTGWSGACSGNSQCSFTADRNQTVIAAFDSLGLRALNHIVFMLQENRSLDHLLGHLPEYWQTNGFPPQPFDGMPSDASNPNFDRTGLVQPFHLLTACVENVSPSWNESHLDWNRSDPLSSTPMLDGFVRMAGGLAMGSGFTDTQGLRAMGFYNGRDLPYYYFMASNFATSDRWFSPIMSRTQPNRMYMLAATSAGHVYPLQPTDGRLKAKTIFELLDEKGISYKIYVTDYQNGFPLTYFTMFTYANQHMDRLAPISEYFKDIANGTLPQVAMVESGFGSGRDEHPSSGSVKTGSHYASTLINAIMNSPSWADSVFILSYDEFGGFYDHVPPQPAVHPDGIPPSDLRLGDICTTKTGPTCDFVFTGYRIPLIVVSPFAKKNYVSHTVADLTAILRLIESRFDLPSLTARDADQIDMAEFFDFVDPPWITPPVPPEQPRNGPCYLDHLP